MLAAHRLRIRLGGAVQGVGFRPFVYNLARETGVAGWVLNSGDGLWVEAEGAREQVEEFARRMEGERPAAAVILTREASWLAPAGYTGFEILTSEGGEAKTAGILPDLATCPECLAELRDPADRRYRYPFTNCTRCGPRYTIVRELPYDRVKTTMAGFALCPECHREYCDPGDRRFHAQPVACPACGPKLEVPIEEAAEALRQGKIVALKGIGGFQLLVDALNEAAVAQLRERKGREAKPFAVLMPSLAEARQWAYVSEEEERLLCSTAAPIVLLKPRRRLLADTSPYLGVMLPYSPLHHLLMDAFGSPVVATSGNLSDEPIAIDNHEARERLGGIADLFVTHDRPIERPVDDSVARVSRGSATLLRRARGYAPMPVRIGTTLPRILAVGGHLKSTVALASGRQVIVSQHIGDLDTLETRRLFETVIGDLCRLYDFRPEQIACDRHPDYYSTRWARAQGIPVVEVQHHGAHAASCAAENEVTGAYLGIAWDGTGYGDDGTVWGSEIFLVEKRATTRVGHLRPFLLPGGDLAAKQCGRCAQALLWELGRDVPLATVLARRVNTPITTSMGRLFDAVASLLGVCQENRYEGESGLMLEALCAESGSRYPLESVDNVADWRPLVEALTADKAPAGQRIRGFIHWLSAWVADVARRTGVRQAVLSGGCFQNAILAGQVAADLESHGVRVYTHQQVPANDGGLSLGQAVLAARTG